MGLENWRGGGRFKVLVTAFKDPYLLYPSMNSFENWTVISYWTNIYLKNKKQKKKTKKTLSSTQLCDLDVKVMDLVHIGCFGKSF